MPDYRVTFIYELGDRGWTETWYRSAANAVAATDFGSQSPFLIPWSTFRVPSCRLAWVRAQEEGGLRRMHLRRVDGGHGHFDRPRDLVPISARVRWPMAGGGYRDQYVRGLADQLIRISDTVGDNPPTRLGVAIEEMGQAAQVWGLRGRRKVLTEKHLMLSVGPNTDFASWTTVTPYTDWRPPVGSRVDFGGPAHPAIQRERGYLVTAHYPFGFAIAHPWPLHMAEQPYQGWVRLLQYEYPHLGSPVFADYTRHVTGKRYLPATWVPDRPAKSRIHPCGRITDVLRTNEAYRCGMRFYASDPDIVLPVRWEFFREHVRLISPINWTIDSGPPIQTVPYEHPFGSQAWNLGTEYETRLGETYARTWHRGRQSVVLSGRGLAGTQRAWSHGIDVGEPPVKTNPDTWHPCPCGPGVPAIQGGAAGGGLDPAVIGALFGEQGGAAAAGMDLTREPIGTVAKIDDCPHWPLAPQQYALEVTGATDAYMQIVGKMNTTHLLTHANGCAWHSPLIEMYNPQAGVTVYWYWRLVIYTLGGVSYLELNISNSPSVAGSWRPGSFAGLDYGKPIDLSRFLTVDFNIAGLPSHLVVVPVGPSHTVFGGSAGAGWDFDPDA